LLFLILPIKEKKKDGYREATGHNKEAGRNKKESRMPAAVKTSVTFFAIRCKLHQLMFSAGMSLSS